MEADNPKRKNKKSKFKKAVHVRHARTNYDAVEIACKNLGWKFMNLETDLKKCSILWHATERTCPSFAEINNMTHVQKMNRFPGKENSVDSALH